MFKICGFEDELVNMKIEYDLYIPLSVKFSNIQVEEVCLYLFYNSDGSIIEFCFDFITYKIMYITLVNLKKYENIGGYFVNKDDVFPCNLKFIFDKNKSNERIYVEKIVADYVVEIYINGILLNFSNDDYTNSFAMSNVIFFTNGEGLLLKVFISISDEKVIENILLNWPF